MPVFETMTQSMYWAHRVRVWRACDEFTMGPDWSVADTICDCKIHHTAFDAKRLVDELSKISRINAIEIVNSAGDGGLYYPEWP